MPKEAIIKIEDICMVQSTLQIAKKNLKKLQRVYTRLNHIEYKRLNNDNIIYFEVWFMFMDEIIHIQKNLIAWIQTEFKSGRLFDKSLWKPVRDAYDISDMFFGYTYFFQYKEYYFKSLAEKLFV